MEINLGKILPTYRGTYDPSTTYTNLDIVSHKGNVYISIIPEHNGYQPDQWDNFWKVLVDLGIVKQQIKREILQELRG